MDTIASAYCILSPDNGVSAQSRRRSASETFFEVSALVNSPRLPCPRFGLFSNANHYIDGGQRSSWKTFSRSLELKVTLAIMEVFTLLLNIAFTILVLVSLKSCQKNLLTHKECCRLRWKCHLQCHIPPISWIPWSKGLWRFNLASIL